MTPEESVVISVPGAQLGIVHVFDKTGAEYVFPDVNVTELRRVLPENGRLPASMPALMVMNAVMSIMSIPLNVVDRILVGTEEVWHG